jgi:hypothetical protein
MMRISRYSNQSATAAALVGVAILAGATACGTTASSQPGQAASTTPSANPLAGLTADQIAAKAVADFKAASSVHMAGSITDSGATYVVDVTSGTTNCLGTFATQGKGSFALLKIGQTLWIKPDNQFWTSSGANSTVLHIVEGKYIQTSPADSDFNGVRMLCSPAQFAGVFDKDLNHLVKGTTTTIAGQSALQLRDTTSSSSAYVTISASPEFLRFSGSGSSSGQLDFSDYNAPVTPTPPPASETIDGSTIGM